MTSAKRKILIAGMGTSPAVLTETVWALAHQEEPVVPDEIAVLTTMSNLRGKLKNAGFADAESLVPQRGRAVMFPLSRIKRRNYEKLAVSVGCELVCVNL